MHRILLLLAGGLLFATLVTRQADLAWMALPLVLYVGMGWHHAVSPRDLHLAATRSVEKIETKGPASIAVRVMVRNQSPRLVRLTLSDSPQVGMTHIQGLLTQSAILRPGEDAEFKYAFRAERGAFIWKTVHAVVSDAFGLYQTELDLPASAGIHIYPQAERFRPFPVHPRRTLHSPGSIPARRGGSGTDFWGVREYHPGDPLRRLDWRLTARHPRQFFTQEFEQEEIAEIGVVLDARRRTDLRMGEDSLFEHSLRATAALAESFLRQGNRVSLQVYQQRITTVFPGYGKVQLNRILRALARVTPELEDSRNGLVLLPVQMFPRRALLIVLSALDQGDWRLFPRLRAFGYQVLVISPDPFDYARSFLPTDPDARMAVRLAQIERQMEISKIKQLWVPVIDWQVDQPLAPLVREALRHAHIQQQR